MEKGLTKENDMSKSQKTRLNEFFSKGRGSLTYQNWAAVINKSLGMNLSGEALRSRYRHYHGFRGRDTVPVSPPVLTPTEQVKADRKIKRLAEDKKVTNKKYRVALDKIERLETVVEAIESVKSVDTHTILPKRGNGKGEAVAVVLASDWHIEETVESEAVNGRNEHSLAISETRVNDFFKGALRLTEVTGRDVKINTMVLALLGDFITGDIHEEMLETSEVRPVEAIIIAQNRIASGIEFLLKNSKLDLIIPCHSGNHSRTTTKPRNATEAGHSLEYIMYNSLAGYFRNEKRVKFLISKSYHSYVEVLGTTIRFHHGHNLRYYGGIGGLTIPVNKAIAQWNKLRWADIDCFGHFHQRIDGGNFMCNGSLIGYNAFALAIKASYEKPSQTFFLIDRKRGKTCNWPILVSV